MPIILPVMIIVIYAGVPVILFFGWRRFWRGPRERNRLAVFSLAGFVLGSLSVLLALGTLLYSTTIGGFPFYDPRLLFIFRHGVLLSLSALALSIPGMWRPNLLRWHAPGLSLGMLLLWLLWASGE